MEVTMNVLLRHRQNTLNAVRLRRQSAELNRTIVDASYDADKCQNAVRQTLQLKLSIQRSLGLAS